MRYIYGPAPNRRKTNAAGELWCKSCCDYHPKEAFSPQRNYYAQSCRESRNRLHHKKEHTVICPVCKSSFICHHSRRKYCSRVCKGKDNLKAPRQFPLLRIRKKTCKECKTIFSGSRFIQYCSKECRRAWVESRRPSARIIEGTCELCHSKFRRLARWKRSAFRYCSTSCSYQARRGVSKRGTPYPTRGVTWIKASSLCRDRDDNKCRACHGTKTIGKSKLPVDHIVPYRLMLKYGFDANVSWNLLTLCVGCHGLKTGAEWALLRGDIVDFVRQLKVMHYPIEAAQIAFEYVGIRLLP